VSAITIKDFHANPIDRYLAREMKIELYRHRFTGNTARLLIVQLSENYMAQGNCNAGSRAGAK
jgi:hypothetical protein